MTVSYIRANGGRAEQQEGAWFLTWPDGERMSNVVFTWKEAREDPTRHHLALDDPRVRRLVFEAPPFVPGQPVPTIRLGDLSVEIVGFWSLWRIGLFAEDEQRYRILPLFLADDGRVFLPTARHIWDRLMTVSPDLLGHLDSDASSEAYDRLRVAAETHGKALYEDLVREHEDRLARERLKMEETFRARREAISRIGLPQVRRHRLGILEREREQRMVEIERRERALPELTALAIVRVVREGDA
jgi:hypothetical protein